MNILEKKGRIPVPAVGQCILRKTDRGKTEGGLIIPDAATEGGRFICYVVATSGRYSSGAGIIVEHEAQPGDMVVLEPDCPAVQMSEMPDDCWVVGLKNVLAHFPGKRAEQH